jgi:hypothetical protein
VHSSVIWPGFGMRIAWTMAGVSATAGP